MVVAKRQKAYKNVRFERGNRIYNELCSQPDSGLFLDLAQIIWGQKLAVQLGYLYVFGHGWCMKGTHYNRMDRANN